MKHNVILIMTDQHRLDTMHYANPASPCRTPALDALAAKDGCTVTGHKLCFLGLCPQCGAKPPVNK